MNNAIILGAITLHTKLIIMAPINRRSFIEYSSILGAGTLLSPKAIHQVINTKNKIRVGVIGTGMRGQSHVSLLLQRDDVEVAAICDIDQSMIDSTLKQYEKYNATKPNIYKDGPYDYSNMLAKEDLDAVIIATPWRWHTEMAVASMEAGIYTGMEVCGGFSLDECWQLVNTHEKTGTHLYFLENVCFRRDVMAILQMVRKDMFGEMVHLECGYQHDLRGVKFNNGKTPYNSGVEFGEKGFSESKWRTLHSVGRNGDLYPTHGIGPISQYIDINRGNRLAYITSMSSKSRGLHDYIVNHIKGGPDHPNAKQKFKLGDKVTSMIKTNNDETIVLHHDTNLPRPYSLGFRVQGTKGLWQVDNKSLYIEGISPSHRWESQDKYMEKHDHPLWQMYEKQAVGAGHGGMDFFLLHSFIEHVKNKKVAPFDAYDAATWLSITPLSEQSIALGSEPMAFPDFTRGKWIDRRRTFALESDTF